MKILNKKGDANMWWIIIGAIIALVALIILILIFTDTTGETKKGFLDCESKGGDCKSIGTCKNLDGTVYPFTCDTGQECCFTEN